MSASTTRPVQYSAPLLLSIFARPHQDGLMRSWRADSLRLRRARSRNYPMLQKSPPRGCRIKICNNRIGANGFLNQRCALTPDLESILRTQTGKILLQHDLPQADMPILVPRTDAALSPVPCPQHQAFMNASRSVLIVSACVAGMPCGKPLYVFNVPL